MYVTLPYDPTGTNPDNHVGSEKHLVVEYAGMPYGMITLENGGFFVGSKKLKVYDKDYEMLTYKKDYIVTYEHRILSNKIGLKVCSGIVFLNPDMINQIVYVSAQMVGSDLAYSFNVVTEYLAFYQTRPAGYIPEVMDYAGTEPIWGPGELAEARWGLDYFQPYVLELENITSTITQGPPGAEDDFNAKVDAAHQAFMETFTTRLADHIADKDNPHRDEKADVQLGDVLNYPVASEAIAREGLSNEHYMTPQRAFQSIETNAEAPLNAHLALTHHAAHGETAAQVGAYDNAQTDALVGNKYLKTERVANANNVQFAGGFQNYDQAIATTRVGLDVSNFTSGLINPSRLGFGAPSNETVLLGDGTWADWSTIFKEQVPTNGSTLVFRNFGVTASEPQLRAWVNEAYGNLAQYPVGTVVFTTLRYNYTWGMQKGRKYYNSIDHCRQYIRTAIGWTFTG